MIVKGTRQLGNFKRGINIYVPKRISTPPAPSGIVAATAGNLLITFWELSDETFVKQNNTYWLGGFEETTTALQWYPQYNRWLLSSQTVEPQSPVGTSAIIPTEGWVYTIGSGPSITITAA